MMTEKKHYAGFWIRVWADLLDGLFLDVCAVLAVLMGLGIVYWSRIFFLKMNASELTPILESIDSLSLQLVLVASRCSLAFFYFTFCTLKYETTLGKKIFRIVIESVYETKKITLNQSILRSLGYVASYLSLGLGFLMPLFHPQKRAMHDLIAGTLCVVKNDTV